MSNGERVVVHQPLASRVALSDWCRSATSPFVAEVFLIRNRPLNDRDDNLRMCVEFQIACLIRLMKTRRRTTTSSVRTDLDRIMHGPTLRDPLVAACAILSLEDDNGSFTFRFAEDENWQRRGFHFQSLKAVRAFLMCVESHWSCKTPHRKCEVIGPDGELYSPGYTAGSMA
jgi:hypothetical protein